MIAHYFQKIYFIIHVFIYLFINVREPDLRNTEGYIETIVHTHTLNHNTFLSVCYTMLVGYSSSSDEEIDNASELTASTDKGITRPRTFEEDCHDRSANKKIRIDHRGPKTRLPVPGCVLAMFPEEEDPETDDKSLHDGRIRSFKHERGNWATYVYFPYPPDEDFIELMEELLEAAGAHGVLLTQQREFHLTVSQTVVLRHHWIQPFTQSLKASLTTCKRS